eukprot:4691013-Amphidinium_carterae.2
MSGLVETFETTPRLGLMKHDDPRHSLWVCGSWRQVRQITLLARLGPLRACVGHGRARQSLNLLW